MRATHPRRPRDGQKLLIEISVRVSDDMMATLKRRSKALGVTMSELVRQYIAKATQ